MSTRIALFSTLLAYSFIVSQSFMYILSLSQVQMSLDAGAYTSFRKLVDSSMRSNFKYAIYGALLANIFLLVTTIKTPGSPLFITAAIAFVALVIDIMLTLKGNLPINDIINTWSPGQIPSNWETFRAKWFHIFQFRQIANITGFLALLVGAVFGNR
ncbi:MAG TPA: hypothetical protein PLC48_13620 [Ferruginibacter sp.]|nr:hypothetical protein [Ferruginibacter sp.]